MIVTINLILSGKLYHAFLCMSENNTLGITCELNLLMIQAWLTLGIGNSIVHKITNLTVMANLMSE